MSRRLDRKYTFEYQTLEKAYASRVGYGAPDWQVEAWVSTYTAIATGELAEVTDDVRLFTGRSPMTLDQLLQTRVPRAEVHGLGG